MSRKERENRTPPTHAPDHAKLMEPLPETALEGFKQRQAAAGKAGEVWNLDLPRMTVLDLLRKGRRDEALHMLQDMAREFVEAALPDAIRCAILPADSTAIDLAEAISSGPAPSEVIHWLQRHHLLPSPASVVITRTPTPAPTLDADAMNRVRALLWRAAIELGQGHPARKHVEMLGDDTPHELWDPSSPKWKVHTRLANIRATLSLMHAPESVLRPLTEAAAILGGE